MELFISDLDGTLLNDNREVSDRSKSIINELGKNGLHFSVATARTAATVTDILTGINFNTPLVLMNGVCLYDINAAHYISVEDMPDAAVSRLHDCIRDNGEIGFFYSIRNDRLITEYVNTDTPNAGAFIRERFLRYGKRFEHKSLACIFEHSLAFYSVSDTAQRLGPMYRYISDIDGLHCDFYPDNYNPGYMYLEVCSSSATKEHGVNKLREICGFSRVTVFGDNLNDIPLMSAGDIKLAVANAQPEIKAIATRVIASNTEDGVAMELLKIFEQNQGGSNDFI